MDAATYEAVAPEMTEMNFYEIPLPPNGSCSEDKSGKLVISNATASHLVIIGKTKLC